MSNAPFDRVVINPREKPLSEDIDRAQSQLDRSLRLLVEQLFSETTGIANDGFLQGGFKVVEQSPLGMFVRVKRGLGFMSQGDQVASNINGVSGLDDRHAYKPMVLNGDVVFTVPVAPVAPNTRIDIIEVKASFLVGDPSTRQVLNETSGQFEPDSVNKTLSHILDTQTGTVVSPAPSTQALSYKQGVVANPGLAPATTSGYIKIAEIAVGSSVASIGNGDITDFRALLINNPFANIELSDASGIVLSGAVGIDASGSSGNHDFSGGGNVILPAWSAIKHGLTDWIVVDLSGFGQDLIAGIFGTSPSYDTTVDSWGLGLDAGLQRLRVALPHVRPGDRLTDLEIEITQNSRPDSIQIELQTKTWPSTIDVRDSVIQGATGTVALLDGSPDSYTILGNEVPSLFISWTAGVGSLVSINSVRFRYDRP